MTLGIGMYAPCMILVGLLGMNAASGVPDHDGFVRVPDAGRQRTVRQEERVRQPPALGLAIGGIPGVLLAAYIFTSLPIYWVRWLVVGVVLIAATMMLKSAFTERDDAPKNPKA